jgi:lysozyme
MTDAVGEDRSSFQNIAGWAGDDFGFAKATEGPDWKDPAFDSNWANLRAEGKPRGAYHFFHPADDPAEQARFFYATVEAQGIIAGDIFIIDAEITTGSDGMEHYGTPQAVNRSHADLKAVAPEAAAVGPAALQFLQELEALAGPSHRLLAYSDLSMAQAFLSECSGYLLYVAYFDASPPSDVAPWESWAVWQASSGGGPGGGDVDYFNGDLAALREWADPAPKPLPAGWTYPPVQKLTAEGGDTSVRLTWDAPVQAAGQVPMPAVEEYEVAVTPGPELEGPDMKTYPRFVPKGKNPETWQGGSLPGKKQFTAGVRAAAAGGAHAGPWAKATFRTT